MKNFEAKMPHIIIIFMLSMYLMPSKAIAQQSGITRTDLQRHDLTASGYEVIQVKVDFEPGIAFGMHSHPGEEIINVLEGTLEYVIEGQDPVILKAGNVLFVPAGKYHSARNVGNTKASELATYIVQKGKPLLLFQKKPSAKE